jgi:hypothetical protein
VQSSQQTPGGHSGERGLYRPRQQVGQWLRPTVDWPKEIALPEGWPDRPEEAGDVAALFPVRPHIEPMLVMSTAHFGPLDREYLDSGKGIVIANSYGWIVYTKQEILLGLMPLLDFAKAQGCLWIKFDADGPVFDEFPTFDWE